MISAIRNDGQYLLNDTVAEFKSLLFDQLLCLQKHTVAYGKQSRVRVLRLCGRQEDALAMQRLNSSKCRSVHFFENVLAYVQDVVRSQTNEGAVKGGVVEGAER